MNWLERQNWLASIEAFSKDDSYTLQNTVKVDTPISISGYGVITEITNTRINYNLYYHDYQGHARELLNCFVWKDNGKYNELSINPLKQENLKDAFDIAECCKKDREHVFKRDIKTLINFVEGDIRIKKKIKYGFLFKLYQILESFD